MLVAIPTAAWILHFSHFYTKGNVMAKNEETWYDGQANTAKLINYAALLILFGSIGWGSYSAWLSHQAGKDDFHLAMFSALGGIGMAAFLAGVAAIIDLLIVQCEALRNR